MEFKGTKEKWEVIENQKENSNGFIAVRIGGFHCTYYGRIKMENEDFSEETKANALLISKAPEMLEMLKELRKWYEENQYRLGDYTPVVFSKALSLIKEATEI